MLEHIHWLGHASFRINGEPGNNDPVIYIDPWRLPPDSPAADLILISHEHHDHCSPDDLDAIRRPPTVIVASARAANVIGGDVNVLRAWQTVQVNGVYVRTVPAYTVDHMYHAQSFGGLGSIVTLMRHDIYFAGDTDLIPEMETIGCDIALLPVGGVYTMNCEEAVEAVQWLKPLIAIPMHYGREIPGSRDLGRQFVQAINGSVQAVELPLENDKAYVS